MNKSAYLLLVLGIGLALVVVCFLLPEQVTQALRHQTQEALGPIIRTAEAPVNFFSHMHNNLTTLDEAQAEVAKLRKQMAALSVENKILAARKAENERLREMLGFRDASPYRLRACQVISREPSSWWDSVQVNVGWQDEPALTKDQPVVSPRGVVGKTGNVSRYVTDIILMVNENCTISACVEGTHGPGEVDGQGNFEEGKPRVRVRYLPKDSTVAIGQFIVTSGLGPYFPAGLRLGTVVEVPPLNNEYPTFGLYREAVIEPTADLNELDELFIVLGTKETPKSETAPATNDEAKPDAAGAATAGSPTDEAAPSAAASDATNSASAASPSNSPDPTPPSPAAN